MTHPLKSLRTFWRSLNWNWLVENEPKEGLVHRLARRLDPIFLDHQAMMSAPIIAPFDAPPMPHPEIASYQIALEKQRAKQCRAEFVPLSQPPSSLSLEPIRFHGVANFAPTVVVMDQWLASKLGSGSIK